MLNHVPNRGEVDELLLLNKTCLLFFLCELIMIIIGGFSGFVSVVVMGLRRLTYYFDISIDCQVGLTVIDSRLTTTTS